MDDDRVKVRCPACTRIFKEKASRIRDGVQINCLNCNKLITMSKETYDSFLPRALKAAREIRAAEDAALFATTYSGAASAPKRDTP